MAAQMSDAHRRFLQVLMSHGIMEGSEARKLHRCCCEIHKGVSLEKKWRDGDFFSSFAIYKYLDF